MKIKCCKKCEKRHNKITMKTKQIKQIKSVSGWGIYNYNKEDFAELFYQTKKQAEYDLNCKSYHSNPLVMKKILENYKIIKVLITPIIDKPKKCICDDTRNCAAHSTRKIKPKSLLGTSKMIIRKGKPTIK